MDSKLKEAKDALISLKAKFIFQKEKSGSYEKQLEKIMETLNIPIDEKSHAMISPVIESLKDSLNNVNVKNETNMLTLAQALQDCLEP